MANILHEFSKNESEYLNEFQQKQPRSVHQFAAPMVIPKHIKRGDNGRYQSVEMKSGRSSVVRQEKKDEVIEPMQQIYGNFSSEAGIEQEDDEICEKCMRKFVEGKEHLEITWIGCDYDGCSKWYHSLCVGMTNEDCKIREEKNESWFCTEFCHNSHNRSRR